MGCHFSGKLSHLVPFASSQCCPDWLVEYSHIPVTLHEHLGSISVYGKQQNVNTTDT